ncbi:CBO0543 family protein [Brevibacillus thermoruber]
MPIVKRWRKSNGRLSPRKRSFLPDAGRASLRRYVPGMLLASLAGTYLDLILVNGGFYSFPVRPFPGVFDINVAYTLILLPFFTAWFLFWAERMPALGRAAFITVLSLAMALAEPLSEKAGWFGHREDWRHLYTVFGYFGFLWLMWTFHRWLRFRA